MKYLILIYLLISYLALGAQSQTVVKFYDFTTNKSGLKDDNGKVMLDAQYDKLVISDTLVWVKNSFWEGVLNIKGEVVLPVQYDRVNLNPIGSITVFKGVNNRFYHGLTDTTSVKPFSEDGSWFMLSSNGDTLVNEGAFDFIKTYSQGKAEVSVNGKWGYIDETGKIIIAPTYDKAKKFKNGLAVVSLKDQYGVINAAGEVVIELKYENLQPFLRNFAIAKINNKYGTIDKQGKVVIPFDYDGIRNSKYNNYVVKIGSEMGILNEIGEEYIPVVYSNVIEHFVGAGGDVLVKRANKLGIYSTTKRKEIIPTIYDDIKSEFIEIDGKMECYYRVTKDKERFIVDRNNSRVNLDKN